MGVLRKSVSVCREARHLFVRLLVNPVVVTLAVAVFVSLDTLHLLRKFHAYRAISMA